jgi:hypothetical protein
MKRREFLKLTAIGFVGAKFLSSGLTSFAQVAYDEDEPLYGGWIDSPASRKRFLQTQTRPYLSQMNAQIRGTGQGKTVLLYQFIEKVLGHPFIPHNQEIGDCVSHAYGAGVDILTAVQICQNLVPQQWVAESATEIIYAGARVQAANKKYHGDGCNGTDAAQFVKQYGVLLRQKYFNGKYDYSNYDGNIAKRLGNSGVPTELLPICHLHPVETVSLVRTWAECRDAIANGYPVTMCSNVGFSTHFGRDKEGFLPPGRRPWNHAMLIAGIDDNPKRPGGLIINSWGTDWVNGPTRLGQPQGSFWADASVIERALRQGDSVALSSYIGYPLQNLDYRFW